MKFKFWFSDNHGLIRQRSTSKGIHHPEVLRNGHWHVGTSYVVDAISGMGEDPYSCGEYSDAWTESQAKEFAAKNGIDLFADNPEDPHLPAKRQRKRPSSTKAS